MPTSRPSGSPDPGCAPTSARWLLAQELEFHWREQKPEYWEKHRLRLLDDEELLDERRALVGLVFTERLPSAKRSTTVIDRYEFPLQDCDIDEGDKLKLTGEAEDFGQVVAINRGTCTIDIKKRKDQTAHHPHAVFEHQIFNNDTKADSLFRFGEWIAAHGIDAGGAYRAASELLLRRAPRVLSGAFAARPSETALDFATRMVAVLDGSVLPIQGPPGAGKTHAAAHMICGLVRAGKKVGVTAHSHKVIHNLLEKVIEVGQELHVDTRCLAKVSEEEEHPPFGQTTKTLVALHALEHGEANVVGGTAWLWASPDMEQSVDVLFVDEAGQVSLADALSAAPAARNIVLVGDPRQLVQPLKGSHPDGAAVSALNHLFGEHATVPEDRGIFLAETWRLCPNICEFTSVSFYEGRLKARAGRERQRLAGTDGFDGAGLWHVPVIHEGNRSSSPEEVSVVVKLVQRLLQPGAAWIDPDGKEMPLKPRDILVVAPYNAQVSRLAEALESWRLEPGQSISSKAARRRS